MGVPWNWGSLPLMYDPAAVSAPPESWLDILKPEFQGKVAMVDDPLGNLLIWGTVVTGKPMGTILTKEEMVQVIDKLIEIKTKHARAFFASYGDMSDAFARNEVTVSARSAGKRSRSGPRPRARPSNIRSRRKAPACSWIACASPRTPRIRSSATR